MYCIKIKTFIPKVKDVTSFRKSLQGLKKDKKRDAVLAMYLKEFDDYEDQIKNNFISMTVPSDEIIRVRFKYERENVWREFEVFADQTLERLAGELIESLNWWCDHLHAFYFPEKRRGASLSHWHTNFSISSQYLEDETYPELKTNKVLVGSINYEKFPKLGFVFDFGDDHSFYMMFKSRRKVTKNDSRYDSPKLVDQRGVAQDQSPDLLE